MKAKAGVYLPVINNGGADLCVLVVSKVTLLTTLHVCNSVKPRQVVRGFQLIGQMVTCWKDH
jgi:hypothetical protein